MSEISIINIKRTHYLEHINGDSKQGHFTRFEIETTGARDIAIIRFAQKHLCQTRYALESRASFISKVILHKERFGLYSCHTFIQRGQAYYTLEPLDKCRCNWVITIFWPSVDWLYDERNFKWEK